MITLHKQGTVLAVIIW